MSGIFIAEDRSYSAWHIEGNIPNNDLDPVFKRVLTGDIIYENGTIKRSSYIRTAKSIPGVLSLKGATYGKYKNKFLYKCVPNNKQIPSFLIPYDASKKKENLSNVSSNLFVLFKFVYWNDKHPLGQLVETIGKVSDINAYSLYQMHTKSLQYPRKKYQTYIKNILGGLKAKNVDIIHHVESKANNIQDRTTKKIITIDPLDTVDFDDAFSCDVSSYEEVTVSVYISNVPLWLNVLQYWNQIPPTPATIYLPNTKYSMFPSILGDNLFSLIEKKERFALAMDVVISKHGIIQSVSFASTKIMVSNNFRYNDSLNKNKTYSVLKNITSICNKNCFYLNEINDSHDVVAFWMMFMNHKIGLKLLHKNVGIFRSTESIKINCTNAENISPVLQTNVERVFQQWNQDKANYVLANKNKGHSLIGKGISAYAQSTSPIRRLVDIVNLTHLQIILGLLNKTNDISDCLANIEDNIETINNKMNSIKSVQNKCHLLHKCSNISIETPYEGYVIAHEENKDAFHKHTIYIPSINIISYIETSYILNLREKGMYNIFVFEDETTLHKKVRLKKIN